MHSDSSIHSALELLSTQRLRQLALTIGARASTGSRDDLRTAIAQHISFGSHSPRGMLRTLIVHAREDLVDEATWRGRHARYRLRAAVMHLPLDILDDLLLVLTSTLDTEQLDRVATTDPWKGYFVPAQAAVQGGVGATANARVVPPPRPVPAPRAYEQPRGTRPRVEPSLVGPTSQPQREVESDAVYEIVPPSRPPPGFRFRDEQLFGHQKDALAALTRWHAGSENGGVLCLPTGSGKTRTAVELLLNVVLANRQRVLWLAHRRELTRQAVDSLIVHGRTAPRAYSIGRYEAGAMKVRKRTDMLVASLPTLVRTFQDRYATSEFRRTHGEFDLVVVDECHHSVAGTWKRMLMDLRGRGSRLLGLSATPTRTTQSQAAQLWSIFGRVVYEAHLPALINDGVLARPAVTAVATHETFDATPQEQRDYARLHDLPPSLVARIADHAARNRAIVKTYIDGRARWGSTLVFAATRAQASMIGSQLRRSGIDARELYGTTPAVERDALMRDFRDRRFAVLVNVLVFSEGTDLPGVTTVFVGRPTRSEILFRQMVGRGMRGPRVGGTPECNIVTFHDQLVGIDRIVATSFSSEAETLSAIGLPPPAEADAPSARATEAVEPEPEPRAGLAERVRALQAFLQGRPPNQAAGALPAVAPLVGWWQTMHDARPRFLPVFQEDEAGARERVAALLRTNVPASDPLFRWISDDIWERFSAAVRASGVAPSFVSAAWASVEQVLAVAEALQTPPLDGGVAMGSAAVASPVKESLLMRAEQLLAQGGDGARPGLDALRGVKRWQLDILHEAWVTRRALLPAGSDSLAIDLFLMLVAPARASSGLSLESARLLIEDAARTGEWPDVTLEDDVPATLDDAVDELRAMAGDDRARAVELIYRAFFANQYETREAFLIAMLGRR